MQAGLMSLSQAERSQSRSVPPTACTYGKPYKGTHNPDTPQTACQASNATPVRPFFEVNTADMMQHSYNQESNTAVKVITTSDNEHTYQQQCSAGQYAFDIGHPPYKLILQGCGLQSLYAEGNTASLAASAELEVS